MSFMTYNTWGIVGNFNIKAYILNNKYYDWRHKFQEQMISFISSLYALANIHYVYILYIYVYIL